MELNQKAKRTQIYLDPWQDTLLQNRAEKSGKTRSAIIRQALNRYLSPHKRLSYLELVKRVGRGTGKMNIPSDVSERHDYYIAEAILDHFNKSKKH